jgi:tetratricopeptide (TPR) repeat protein
MKIRLFMNRVFALLFLFITQFALCQQTDMESDSLQLADQHIASYQFSKALKFLNPRDTLNIAVLQRRGHCFFRLGNYESSIRLYQMILRRDSTNTNALYQLGQLYSRNNQYADAYQAYLTLIKLDSTNGYYYKQFSVVASQSNDFVTTAGALSKAVELNPRDVEAYTMYANALLELEQFEAADSILNDALQLNVSPQLILLLAKAKMGLKKYREVITLTEGLVAKSDTIPTYARLLGVSYYQVDRYDKVLAFMKYLVKTNYKADWIYYYMGVSYHQLKKPDSAIVYLNKAIDQGISPNISNYYTQLASSYEELKDYKSAIKYYRAAYESSRSDILLYHLARNYDVYYKDKSQAIAYYKRYLNSDDTIKLAREYTRLRLDELSVYR